METALLRRPNPQVSHRPAGKRPAGGDRGELLHLLLNGNDAQRCTTNPILPRIGRYKGLRESSAIFGQSSNQFRHLQLAKYRRPRATPRYPIPRLLLRLLIVE